MLSAQILESLSYQSSLRISLKNNLHKVAKDTLLYDLQQARRWYKSQLCQLEQLHLQFRIKSLDSIILKYDRYYPNTSIERTYNDLLGFRIICHDYAEADSLRENNPDLFKRISDMRHGKKIDDGYRGVHLYFQLDHQHYPIELQFNTPADRQLNDWLHSHLYKKGYSPLVGKLLRQKFTAGKIQNLDDFRRELYGILSSDEQE